MPGPSWFGEKATQAGGGFFKTQPRSDLLVSTASRASRDAMADTARFPQQQYFIFVPKINKRVQSRFYVKKYDIKSLFHLLDVDGNPSFNTALKEFCYSK